MKKPKKALPSLSIYPRDGRAEAFGVPSSQELGPHNHSQYAFLSCLSSFMVRYSGVLGVEEPHQSIPNLVVKLYYSDDTVGEGTPGNRSSGDEVGPVAQRIGACGYEPRCRGFESLLAHNRPKKEGLFPLGLGKSYDRDSGPKAMELGCGSVIEM
ncbi:hypothetical protein E6C27_scaffold1639G00300 [Cucumis melo var. makuwa]|uniref:Uncharacterized protein n=1 Tax=Cucumis melo var. makuwa TaxID=1194695 RepID=A0A5A7TJG6_CUCMM|nr:hypothetical protein E6C27_scaffold1639G00300 [Cucumis melo var. makuwa]